MPRLRARLSRDPSQRGLQARRDPRELSGTNHAPATTFPISRIFAPVANRARNRRSSDTSDSAASSDPCHDPVAQRQKASNKLNRRCAEALCITAPLTAACMNSRVDLALHHLEQRKVALTVSIVVENRLPLVPAASAVITSSRKMNARFSCHASASITI